MLAGVNRVDVNFGDVVTGELEVGGHDQKSSRFRVHIAHLICDFCLQPIRFVSDHPTLSS